MSAATSVRAQQELDATASEIQQASDAYDRALTSGNDSDVAEAEAALARLRRTHARLERQVGVLRSVEATSAQVDRVRTQRRIDEALVRCRRAAVEALEAFVPALREQLATVDALAHEAMGAELLALDDAQRASDEWHNDKPTLAADEVVLVHRIDREMLGVLAGLHLPKDLRRPHLADLNALLGVESFVRKVCQTAPASGDR